jgi:hypothetical protein
VEAPVRIDIIDNDGAAWPQGCPCPIHFKANIAFAVQTIVNEKIDLVELAKYARQAPPARAKDVRPSVLEMAINGNANLSFQLTFHNGRPINTPEMAITIFLERFKNET